MAEKPKLGSFTANTFLSRGHVELGQALKAFPESIHAPDSPVSPLIREQQEQAAIAQEQSARSPAVKPALEPGR